MRKSGVKKKHRLLFSFGFHIFGNKHNALATQSSSPTDPPFSPYPLNAIIALLPSCHQHLCHLAMSPRRGLVISSNGEKMRGHLGSGLMTMAPRPLQLLNAVHCCCSRHHEGRQEGGLTNKIIHRMGEGGGRMQSSPSCPRGSVISCSWQI